MIKNQMLLAGLLTNDDSHSDFHLPASRRHSHHQSWISRVAVDIYLHIRLLNLSPCLVCLPVGLGINIKTESLAPPLHINIIIMW